MPTKTQTREVPPTGPKPPTPEQLDAAYQVHTLAQLLYGQMAVHQPHPVWNYPPMHYGTAPVYYPDPIQMQMMGGYPKAGTGWMPGTPTWGAPQMWPHTFGYQQFPR